MIACAEFFARIAYAVLKGQSPSNAIENVLKLDFSNQPIAELISQGIQSRDRETRETIAEFGQACNLEAGLPGAIHLITRYSGDFKAAMIENVMAGGDSSARGILAGVVLCAAQGMAATLTITPDKSVYQIGEQITLDVFGDAEGEAAHLIVGAIRFDPALVAFVSGGQRALTSFGVVDWDLRSLPAHLISRLHFTSSRPTTWGMCPTLP